VTDTQLSLLKFQLEADLAAAVEAIRADTLAGPLELARRGAEAVLRLTDKAHYERPLHINLEVQGLACALVEVRPDCIPLINLASETARPLPELYGRGKTEGARMRADLRTRIEAWVAALDARAARIDALRSQVLGSAVTAQAIASDSVYVVTGALMERPRFAIGGLEKFVPPNYEFNPTGLESVPLADWDGILTGDSEGPQSPEEVRRVIATLRFESILL
jgi:hypothetical protein